LSPVTGRGPDTTERVQESQSRTDVCGRDRQILVVGDGLAAAAATGFLEQAGLDPVLATSANERTQSKVVVVWQPGLALLERIGLRRPVERHGVALNRLRCSRSGQSWTGDATARPSLVAVRRSRLRDLLTRFLFDRVRTAERPVTTVEAESACVRATFEQGIEEPFDTVLTTDRSLLTPVETDTRSTAVHVWEFEWPTDVPAPDAPTEAWDEALAAFSVPLGDDTRVQLVSALETAPSAAVSTDALVARFGHLFPGPYDPFSGFDDTEFKYWQVPRAIPASLCVGRAALVGPAARTHVPGNCLGPSFGVEDAWVLADTLAYGPRPIDDALEAYETRRQRRANELCPSSDDGTIGTRTAVDLSPPLQRLCATRTLAFSHAIDGRQPELARAVPESL
jgi:2-polyprenyl-6-methoxyphenol hydroxylase-like FAD-dependent oxidoreductase